MKKELNSTKVRRILKAAFITVSLVLFLSMLVGTSDLESIGTAVSNAFAVLFGLMVASLAATVARSVVKIPSPSKKLLIIVSVSCGAGFIFGALISGFVLKLVFSIGLIVGIIGIVAGIFAYLAAYSTAMVVFAGNLAQGALSFATEENGMAADLRKSIQNDEKGFKTAGFWKAISDLEKEEHSK